MPRYSSSKLTDNTGEVRYSSKGTIKPGQEAAIKSRQEAAKSKHENISTYMDGRAPGAGNSSTSNLKDSSSAIKLDLSNDNLLNGILLAELLGRPKCLKRGRW